MVESSMPETRTRKPGGSVEERPVAYRRPKPLRAEHPGVFVNLQWDELVPVLFLRRCHANPRTKAEA